MKVKNKKKILLINIDKKYPNFALEKIASYHKEDKVIRDIELLSSQSNKIYVSCIFSWNKYLCRKWEGIAEIGGSGYSLIKTLPREIEKVNPHINWGFTTRGCIRNCPFCIVRQKEGGIRVVGDLYNLWDGKSKDIVLLDNNILALPNHFQKVCNQAHKEKVRLDFNQGLDFRLLTNDICSILKIISHKEYRFAFDYPELEKGVDKAIKMLQKHGINKCTWYVLVGFNTTFEQDLRRLNFLKDRNQNAYVQRFNKTKDKKYIQLARWSNQKHIFNGMTYKQFLESSDNKFDNRENYLI